ncbi:hypothetical protein ACGLWX_06590 [Halomonas sp. HMF6819]|uniref:hypothetical protein n=1 Tax=unclassified Halomonas TaxID=2609666 RepID=UPI002076ACB1|nr:MULTISPECIES: hypothetical protein [unclassified Halomonas]
MIWHLIAAVFAALAAAGIGLILRKATGNRLPKWIVPVMAGLGMLGYQIHVEYSWFEHKKAQLPPSTEVVDSATGTEIWRPWTFVFPMTTQFSVLDRESLSRSGDVAEFMLYHFERHYTDLVIPQAYVLNCQSRELVPVAAERREPDLDGIRTLRADSTLLQSACNGATA